MSLSENYPKTSEKNKSSVVITEPPFSVMFMCPKVNFYRLLWFTSVECVPKIHLLASSVVLLCGSRGFSNQVLNN